MPPVFSKPASIVIPRPLMTFAVVLSFGATLILAGPMPNAVAQTLDEELVRDDFGSYGQSNSIEVVQEVVADRAEQNQSYYSTANPAVSNAGTHSYGTSSASSYSAQSVAASRPEGRVVGHPAPQTVYTGGQSSSSVSSLVGPSVATTQSPYLAWNDNTAFDKDPRAKTIRRLIEDSAYTLDGFLADKNYEPMWRLVDDAKALVVVPRLIQGGFIWGGSGGNAVVISRQPDGSWSHPTFFTIGSASFGLQLGAEFSETVLMVMTDRGRNQFLKTNVKLGGDIGIAAGPYGAGAKAQTTDILAFSKSKGLYGGISIEGSVLKRRTAWDRLYYGNDQVTSTDILIRNSVGNPHSQPIHAAAYRLVERGASLPPRR